MPTTPRELRPAELFEVAKTLAEVATPASVHQAGIVAQLDIASSSLNLSGAPREVWHRLVNAVHAGISATASYRADASPIWCTLWRLRSRGTPC